MSPFLSNAGNVGAFSPLALFLLALVAVLVVLVLALLWVGGGRR